MVIIVVVIVLAVLFGAAAGLAALGLGQAAARKPPRPPHDPD